MVYVLSASWTPLMPAQRCGHVRRMLRDEKARVVKRMPFAIQLTYESTTYMRSVSLGIDTESKYVGISAETEDKELYAGAILCRIRDHITAYEGTETRSTVFARTRRKENRY